MEGKAAFSGEGVGRIAGDGCNGFAEVGKAGEEVRTDALGACVVAKPSG